MRATSVLVFGLLACTPSGYDVVLSDRSESLTSSGTDKLFDLQVAAADENVETLDLQLTFQPAGGSMIVLNFELSSDADGNGTLSTGDVLTAVEPGVDVLGPTSAGQTFSVMLAEKLDGNRVVTLWEGAWVAR